MIYFTYHFNYEYKDNVCYSLKIFVYRYTKKRLTLPSRTIPDWNVKFILYHQFDFSYPSNALFKSIFIHNHNFQSAKKNIIGYELKKNHKHLSDMDHIITAKRFSWSHYRWKQKIQSP